MAELLLAWYDRHRRVLPWRARPGERPDPYNVWLSEIMLQQTTVAAVGPYFLTFLARWPDVAALAAAPLDDVLTEWAGLGYYARARNLHKCAQAVVREHGGRFPDGEDGLRALPGIGAYTAAAIAAIAFDRRAVVMDGNVERVMARLHRVAQPLPAAKAVLRDLADALTPQWRAGDYAQAVMDLGATICTPRKPRCALCPWRQHCAGFAAGDAEDFPVKTAKPVRPVLHATAYWMTVPDGSVVLRRRPEKGLLGGMMEIPTNTWRIEPWTIDEARAVAPVPANWRDLPGNVRHVFTHIDLRLTLLAGSLKNTPDGMVAAPLGKLGDYALPSVMRKIVNAAVRGG
ncbi:MAG TPA: A/G-specific adenine glycosylase [Candidatus Cybelea sp.]|nr:A/G-specific adenine glycosylase [Candidatus Cybelea sp.]